jgi:hypothetical protein
MSNAPKPAKAKPRSRCLTPIYPLSTNHYLLRGLKSLPIKRMSITHCGRITCQEKIRNPVILKDVTEREKGADARADLLRVVGGPLSVAGRLGEAHLP